MSNSSAPNYYRAVVRLPIAFTLLCLAQALNLQEVLAQQIYKSLDASGKVVYSTERRGEPAKLPELLKNSPSSELELAKRAINQSCQNHRGIDCARGKDGDGSVICGDGTTSSIESFAEYCLAARLKAQQPLFEEESGAVIGSLTSDFDRAFRMRIVLRNLSAIEAKGVRVQFPLSPVRERIEFVGPNTIDGYGIGEYTLPLDEVKKRFTRYALPKIKPLVECENCRGILGPVQEAYVHH